MLNISNKISFSNDDHAMTTWQRCITFVTKHFFSLIVHTAAADDDDEENPGGDSEDDDDSMSGIQI